jgi:hypothetical protein
MWPFLKRNFRVAWRGGTQALVELMDWPVTDSSIPNDLPSAWPVRRSMRQFGVWQMQETRMRVRGYCQSFGKTWPARRNPSLPTLVGLQ